MLETQVAISYAFASCILRERVAQKTREKGKTKAAASGVGCPWDFHMKGRNGGSYVRPMCTVSQLPNVYLLMVFVRP